MFIDNGMVAFVTSYHKGFGASQRMKIVHRYVPEEVGELVVYYLWLVEPFVRSLRSIARDEYDNSPWIWEPQPEDQWTDGEATEPVENTDHVDIHDEAANEEESE